MPPRYPQTGPVTLRTNLKTYPLTAALKAGKIPSSLVTFDFCGPEKVFEGFRPMIEHDAYDVGEMAIVTFLQAKAFGKELTLLPACIVGKFQYGTLYYAYRGRQLDPKEIEGRTAVVRAYTQTTAVWARGILQHEFGVDLSRVTWLTGEGAHVAAYKDPANVVRAEGRKSMEQRMLDGEADFGCIGIPAPTHPDIRLLIPDHEAAARRWHARFGCAHINHMFVVNPELASTRPDVVAEIFRLLAESKAAAGLGGGAIDPVPFGIDNVAASVEMISQFACEQGVIPRAYKVEELFDPAVRQLKA
jgi:4,5-dihydroxyphthalate decarboxylase